MVAKWKKGILIAIPLIIVVAIVFVLFRSGQDMLTEEEIRDYVGEQFAGSIESLEESTINSQPAYIVELLAQSGLYVIQLDALSGEVLSLEQISDVEGIDPKEVIEPERTLFSIEEVHEIINERIGEDVTIVDYELNEDDGKHIYEIEVRQTSGIGELKINAETGEILVHTTKEEAVDDQEWNVTPTYISHEEAGRIAQEEVGGVIDDIELDDDGRGIYEVELEVGDSDVDVYIDAVTGEVLKIEW